MAKSRNIVRSGMNNNLVGAAAEKLVAYDLWMRGAIEVTWPDDSHSADDIHARFLSGWYSIQVKTGVENTKTGRVTRGHRSGKISSHILALAGVRTKQVRYLPNTKEVPEELRATV